MDLSTLSDIPNLVAHLLLGQEGAAPPAPGSPAPTGPAPAPGGGGGGSPFSSMLFPMVLCLIVFYLLLMLPEQRKQKARKAMIRNVKKGDQVVTTAGIVGKVTKVDGDEVVLQVDRDNDVRIRFQKSAIHDVVPEGTAAEAGSPQTEGSK
jgi:preprotein translocase subunit YajC